MIGFGAPAMAQNNNAVIEEVSKLIKTHGDGEAIKAIFKANKKNPEVLLGMGRAYLEVKDTANASKYANLALARNKKYAKAFILLGDIAVFADDGGKAAEQYQQAKYFDPKDPEGYFKYANILRGRSPEEAAQNLEELRTQRPDIAVDALVARIYYSSNKMQKSVDAYAKVTDYSKLADEDITNYATASWMLQQRDKSLEIAKYGLSKNARKAAWNRLAFYNLTDMNQSDEALKYADALFNNSDSAKISGFDYTYYGTALKNAKQYDKAIEMFQKTIEAKPDDAELVQGALKSISKAYSEKGDIENAAATYNKYLDSMKDKVTAYDYGQLASMYTDQAEKVEGDAKVALLMKADAVYATIAERFAEYADFATYQRAHIGFALDPETKTGAAKPHYEKLIEIIKGHATKAKNDDARLIESYRYLGYYYLLQNDKATADGYWNKVLELDPENETAKQALGIQ